MEHGGFAEATEESQGSYVEGVPEQKKINNTNSLQVVVQVESGDSYCFTRTVT